MTLLEIDEAANAISSEVDPDANIIFGAAFHPLLEGTLRVSVIATGMTQIKASAPAAPPVEEAPAPAPVPEPAPRLAEEAAPRPVEPPPPPRPQHHAGWLARRPR